MDIHYIRQNHQTVKDNQQKRYGNVEIVDKILSIDEEWRSNNYKADSMRKLKNGISACFKTAPAISDITINDEYTLDNLMTDINSSKIPLSNLTKDQLQLLGKYIGETISGLEKLCNKLLEDRDNLISTLGNFLHPDVVVSDNEENNKIIYETGIPDELLSKPLNHIDLCEKLGFVDTDSGVMVSGNRGYFLTGMGVRLNLALINYAMEFLEKKGYTLMGTPHTVNKELMSKITQLSEYEETLYKLEGYDKFLIATSEQPLTAYFANKQVEKPKLPIKFAGLSPCYRKETGRHGVQTRGIYRVHQFEKVEQFCVTEPEKSWDMFYEMMNTTREFYDSLGIKYRVISIVSGALNNAGAMKYDLEAWFPGLKNYGELVSCTNCLDYFSKRIGTKIKNTKEYAHMLNCTLMANTRVICCLMEQYQTEDGMQVPEPLRKYLGCDKILFR
ncbi:seryl-tRNA synthetase type 1 [Fadolivirus algeromassiliense]|jgi:seryl-tRNA synthetase|uniref:serine--tRNA ligase n=1 Tax=Fadolivirus FV1/VV64 TaxID=3070911 RepID=A0A7D3UNZ5_9VIRU|nr:seryl-tRNA synthetase type 1 [Fadolivirus algeromassiliense]QKF93708.1 seryl-tRNA synthetase type 1 [Fadolivirus FV1/VV64]